MHGQYGPSGEMAFQDGQTQAQFDFATNGEYIRDGIYFGVDEACTYLGMSAIHVRKLIDTKNLNLYQQANDYPDKKWEFADPETMFRISESPLPYRGFVKHQDLFTIKLEMLLDGHQQGIQVITP